MMINAGDDAGKGLDADDLVRKSVLIEQRANRLSAGSLSPTLQQANREPAGSQPRAGREPAEARGPMLRRVNSPHTQLYPEERGAKGGMHTLSNQIQSCMCFEHHSSNFHRE